MASKLDEEAMENGYEFVSITNIGTKADEQYLSTKHGYMPAPLLQDGKADRFIKALWREECVTSDNSVKTMWQGVSGQTARYATTAIKQNDVIIDLKTTLKRFPQASIYTIQLSEGYHYTLQS
ncbi:MAG: hypothetical protein SGARI_005800 [Bacillariaceae sp.]